MVTAERKSILNITAGAVLMCLGWWSFCNSFFFAAPDSGQAFFWHRLGSIGWCGFVVFTAYYFFALTSDKKKITQPRKTILFFAPAVILTLVNLFGKTTSLAQGIIPSSSGFGWTYKNSITSLLLWAYLIYVVLYFGFAFYLLYHWARNSKHKMKRELAVGFIVLDVITILSGTITDVILPLTGPALPAMANIATALFGLGYFVIFYRHDLSNIDLVVSSNDILQISNNSIFVMDENKEILRYSKAVGSLLGYSKSELMGADFMTLTVGQLDFAPLYAGKELVDIEAKLRCKDGLVKDVLLSASVAKDKRNSFLCIIVSCQDISTQKKIQQEFALERERYKNLAGDYERLAFFDPLTSLPNRRLFFEILNDFEKQYYSRQIDFAVIFLDLDNFKQTNDLYGHRCGDELLIATAKKLQDCAENEEFVSRLGGDEFMVIMPCTDVAFVERKLQRIRDEFQKSIPFEGKQYKIRISAGYGIYSQSEDTSKLIQKADTAMYDNKKASGNQP
ncbi:MAG: diguanylate cyclase [Oscillospiraceae bacterium]